MNREFDREIDALLRRHTRAAARGRVLDDEGSAHSPSTVHLDADELNAFAENAVPPAARSLYVAHLADCGACRHAVAGLAQTSNVSVEAERMAVNLKGSEAVAARGGWLSKLFAPRVLRYAFPALALCLVGVIAFVALRSTQRDGGGMLAEHKESEANRGHDSITREATTGTAPGVGASGDANQNSNASITMRGASANQSPQLAHPAERQAADEALKAATAPGPATGAPELMMAPPPAPPPATATQAEPVGVVGERAPAPKPVAKEKGEDAKVNEVAARESKTENYNFDGTQQVANRAGQPRKVDIDQMPDGSRNTQRSESNTVNSRAANNLPMLSRRAEDERAAGAAASKRGRAAAPRDRRDDEESVAEAETRTVSNHRFRRQGGAWVDVKYTTSLPTTGVRRGSDGYRALVADIPEIGRIAEQLSGEVVVVVKGRAYRIR